MSNKNFLDLGEVAETIIADFNLEIEKHKMINFLIDLCKDEPTASLHSKDQKLVLFVRSSDQVNPTYVVTNGDTTHSYSTNKDLIMRNSTPMDTDAFAVDLKNQFAPFDIKVPDDVVEILIKRHIAICDNGAKNVDQGRVNFSTPNGTINIDAKIYPSIKETDVYVIGVDGKNLFKFNHRHKGVEQISVDQMTKEQVMAMEPASRVIPTSEEKGNIEMELTPTFALIGKVETIKAAATFLATECLNLQSNHDKLENLLNGLDIGVSATFLDRNQQTVTITESADSEGNRVFVATAFDSYQVTVSKKQANRANPFDNLLNNIRLKNFLNKMKKAETPNEAYNLLTEWLGEDQEHEGKFSYKDMVVMYGFEYDKARRSIQSNITIGNKVKCEGCGKAHEVEVIFSMSANLTNQNIDKFYGSVKSFVENFMS